MPRYDFWTHGVAGIVEHVDRVKEERRSGSGLRLSQAPGTDNWVHFAIPTPYAADDHEEVELRWFEFSVELSGVRLAQVTAHYGGTGRIMDTGVPLAAGTHHGVRVGDPGGGPPIIQQSVIPQGGVVLCLRPEFERSADGDSFIRFFGAGARFDA